jgi:hypothetical protein
VASALDATAAELLAEAWDDFCSQPVTESKSIVIKPTLHSGFGKVFIVIPLLFVIAVFTLPHVGLG